MRNLLVFVVAVLMGGALVFALSRLKQREAPAATERAPAAVPARAEPEDDSAAQPLRKPAPEREPAQPVDETPKPEPGPSSLSGTIVVVDDQGVEHAEEDGILALGLGGIGPRTHGEVDVRGGRWSLPIASVHADAPPGSMALRGCVLGKKPALPAHGQATDLAIPADGQFALRVRWADPVLHVRARDTGRELAEVTLYELPLAQRGSPLDVRHPGPNAKSLGRAAGPSPIRLDADASSELGLASRVFFAKSPGYAWGRIEVDPKQEEDSTLSLDPSAALELAVVGEAQDTELEVLLLEAEPPHAEVLDVQRGQAKSFVLDDLRPGRYTAEARHSGLLAGTQEIEVRAGERVKAVLQVTQPTAPEVPLEGVLVVPAAWKLDDFMLEFLLQGRFDRGSLSRGSFEIRRSQMELEKGSREVFRWKAPSAVVGRYRLSLFQAHFFAELDTGPTGTRDARIEVPPPCIVALHLVDEESRAEVWSEKATCSVGTSRLMAVLRMGSQPLSSFEFLLPQGRVLLCTTPVSYEAAARLIDAGPGTNDVLLLLKKRP